MSKQLPGLINRKVQDIGNGVAFVSDLQGGIIETLSLAVFTGHIHVSQKVHFHLDVPVPPAGFTAATFDIEGVAALFVSTHSGFRQLGKKFSDMVKHFGIGGGIASRGPADSLLVDVDAFIQMRQSLNTPVLANTKG